MNCSHSAFFSSSKFDCRFNRSNARLRSETSRMMTLVRSVRDRGVTIMLVEHDMHAIMGLCDKITVMNFGSLLTEGTPQQVRTNPKVIEAYLGSAIDAA